MTHHEWPWCECEWQHRLTTFRLSPRHTCTIRSPPPSGCSWSRWTKAGPCDQKCSLCPRQGWPNGGRLSEPGWCRTPSFSRDTSILHGWHTEAHSDTGLWGIDPPGLHARPRRLPRRWRLMESEEDLMLSTGLTFMHAAVRTVETAKGTRGGWPWAILVPHLGFSFLCGKTLFLLQLPSPYLLIPK